MPGNCSGKVRIIGGKWKRTPLLVLDAKGLRPTGDRQRETLFNWLGHLFETFEERTSLDMFGGSGALSFEFLSRGGKSADVYEINRSACAQIKKNAEKLNAPLHVHCADSLTITSAGKQYDVIFIDPPFALKLQMHALKAASGLIKPDGLIYVESPEEISDASLSEIGLQAVRRLKSGASTLLLARQTEQ